MFKLNKKFDADDLASFVDAADKNYVIQTDDYLQLDVFTNKGERIVDPNGELMQSSGMNNNRMNNTFDFTYLVQTDGKVKFPIIGQVKVDSLTINDAETLIQERYNEYYKDSFVKLMFANKRVVVLGAAGGQVIPLTNENMSLLEVLALAGGLDKGDNAHEIKVIRGDQRDLQVFRIDLSTVYGMKQTMLDIEPGDVIYIEPWRRPVLDGIKDIASVMGFITSTLAFILVIQNLN